MIRYTATALLASPGFAGGVSGRASELAKLGIPIVILSGDRDAVFGPAARQALIAELPEARATIYPETGHAPHWEQPERFARDLMAFLGR